MTQDTAAAERSAHVTRGPATHDAPSILREVAPGRFQLAAVSDAYRAGLNAAAVELRRQAREMRRTAGGCHVAHANASALEIAADSLAELPMPAARREATGLEYRGG